jgi:single-stranded DNA-binding protein
MALSLSFTGFVEEVKTFDWGSVVTVSHSNRQKNDAGQWETTSRDYIDVTVDPSSEFGWLLQAQKGLRVAITGNAKLSTYNKKDGSAGVRIKLWPKEVDTFEAGAVLDTSDAPF